MSNTAPALPAVPAGGLLRRLTLAVGGGQALDGYDRGVVTVVIPLLVLDAGLGPVQAGLVGASSLLGILVGAPLARWLTGRTGRRLPFRADVLAGLVLAAVQPFVDGTGAGGGDGAAAARTARVTALAGRPGPGARGPRGPAAARGRSPVGRRTGG